MDNKNSEELRRIAEEIRRESERMAIGAREGGKQVNAGLEAVLQSAHRLCMILYTFPDKLIHIAQELEEEGQ